MRGSTLAWALAENDPPKGPVKFSPSTSFKRIAAAFLTPRSYRVDRAVYSSAAVLAAEENARPALHVPAGSFLKLSLVHSTSVAKRRSTRRCHRGRQQFRSRAAGPAGQFLRFYHQ